MTTPTPRRAGVTATRRARRSRWAISTRRLTVARNTEPGAPRFMVARLPVRQTLIWAGPVFIAVRRR